MRALRRHAARPFAILALALGGLTVVPSPAAAQAEFDHGLFDALLHVHVRNGMVDYDAF
ncbi:MAG: hypothetical protein H7247_14110, partial [Polaromonas sp.]|nr:hypothetical protein [Gemmatimonadaceae bacterium]